MKTAWLRRGPLARLTHAPGVSASQAGTAGSLADVTLRHLDGLLPALGLDEPAAPARRRG